MRLLMDIVIKSYKILALKFMHVSIWLNVCHTGTPKKSYSRIMSAILSSWMGDWYWWWYLYKT